MKENEGKLALGFALLSGISYQQIDAEILLNIFSTLTFTQAIILAIQGSVFIASIKFKNWHDKIPVYLFKCEKHGYQLSYPQGYNMNLVCPKCLNLDANNHKNNSINDS